MNTRHSGFPSQVRTLGALLFALVMVLLVSSPAQAVKRIYLANDDHTDYFWTADDVGYRAAFLTMLDYYMTQAEATAGNPSDSRGRYNADCSLWVWEYEHNKTAAQFSRLVGHLRAGTITMPLNPAVLCYGGTPSEGVLRGMYYAGRLERRYALRFPMVIAMENQTLPGGVASLWAGAGAQYSWRGVCGCASRTTWAPRPREIYRFNGPDGQGVTMKWNTMTGVGGAIGGYLEASVPTTIVNYLDTNTAFISKWPWDVSAAFGYGGDALQTTTSAIITASQTMSTASRRVIVSNQVDFFQDFLANHGGAIPTFSGSFGNEWELYQASMGAVSSEFRRELEKLRTAEALATIASWKHPSFMTGREAARDAAFMAAGLFYEHDWTADGPLGRVKRAQFQRDQLTLLKTYVDQLQADALATVAADVGVPAGAQRFVVFNPLSWARTDAIDLTTTISAPRRVVDVATGAEVASQTVSATVVRVLASAVPSVGYRVYEVLSGAPAAFAAATTGVLPTFDNGIYGVTLGTRGQITGVIDHRDANRQMVASGSWLNDLNSGTGTVVLESTGPVSTTLRVTAAGVPAHTTRVTLYAGMDRIEVANTITANFAGTAEYFSRFNLSGTTLHHEEVGMIATASRAAAGGDYADANARTDYLSFGHFADFSEASRGVTISNADCSFFQAGNSTTTTLDATAPQIRAVVGMQVDGSSFGIGGQGGDSQFLNRFAFRAHGAFDPANAMRFSLEHQNPLVAARLTGNAAGTLPPGTFSFVTLPSADVVLWSLKPAEEGIGAGVIARVWNLAQGQRAMALSLPPVPLFTATQTTHLETNTGVTSASSGSLAATLERQQMRTYRLVPVAFSTAVEPGESGPVRGLSVYPNPLGRTVAAAITFRVASRARVQVRVMDVRGAIVATLCDRTLDAGAQQLEWNRRDRLGNHVRSGVYFVVTESAGARTRQRIAVLD